MENEYMALFFPSSCSNLLGVHVILPIENVILQSPWQRQETHENRRAQTKAPETAADPQTTEMLQTAGVLWRRGGGADMERTRL